MHVAQRQRVPLPPPRALSAYAQDRLRQAGRFAQETRADHVEAGLEQLRSFAGGGFGLVAAALENGGMGASTAAICKGLRGIASGGGGSAAAGDPTLGAEGADAVALQQVRGDVSTASRQAESDIDLVRVARAAQDRRPGISTGAIRRATTQTPPV